MSNVEKTQPEVKVVVGGKERVIKYTLGSFRRIHKESGKNPLDGATWENPTPDEIAMLLWAGLVHEQKDLTLDDLADMVDMRDVETIFGAIKEAMEAASPPKQGEAEKKKVAA